MVFINNILSFISLLLIMLGLVFIYIKLVDVKTEKSLIIKLVAYYLLGSFSLKLNGFAIPAGFIIFVLFFNFSLNSIVNVKAKKAAALLGLVAFLISLAIPTVTNWYLERPREIPTSSVNLYSMNFTQDWRNIQQQLSIPEDAKAEHYSLAYDQDGKIRNLSFQLIAYPQGQLTHYQVSLLPNKKVYQVQTLKISEWLQYDRLIQANRLYDILDHVDLQKIIPQGKYSWLVLSSTGERVNYNVVNAKPYLIKGDKIIELSRDQLPITGYYLSSYGMYQTRDTGNTKTYEGRGTQNYLFDTETEY